MFCGLVNHDNDFYLQMSVERQSKFLDAKSLGLLSVALKTVGLVGLGLALGLAIVELIGYFVRFLSGAQSRSLAPISSSVLGSASSAWMNRYHNGLHDVIHPYLGDGRGRLVIMFSAVMKVELYALVLCMRGVNPKLSSL